MRWYSAYYFMVTVHQLFIEQLHVRPSVFSFPDNGLSKYLWIFTKISMCLDIIEIRFGLLMGTFRKFYT